MEIFEFIVLLLACVLLSSLLEQFIPKVSAPLIQIVLGICIYFFPLQINNFNLSNDFFMILFIAPLLYNEARHIDKTVLINNKFSILSLAICLVVISTLVVGYTLNWLIPSIPLAATFALGAALGPTDAISVTSLPENIRFGYRRKGILKGESLINDATGIVSFQFAVAAVTTGTFSALDAGKSFMILFFGGIIIGLIIGFVSLYFLRWARNFGLENTTFHVLFDLLLPFLIYFCAEHFHTSGVLAIVSAGIVLSGFFDTTTSKYISPVSSRMNIVSASVWHVFTFVLNGIVFVYLGTILPQAMVITWLDPLYDNFSMSAYVIFITVVMLISRFIWLLIIEYFYHKRQNNKKHPSLFGQQNVQSALIMTIGGAKGAVTMAIMFSIPPVLANGQLFPGLSLLIFVAGGVVVITLLLSNFAIPLLVPKSERIKQIKEDVSKEDFTIVKIDILRKVIEQISLLSNKNNNTAIQKVINNYSKRIQSLKNSINFKDELNVHYRKQALKWEDEYVRYLLKSGKIKTKIANRYLKNLNIKLSILENNTSFSWKIRNWINWNISFIKSLPKRTKNAAKNNFSELGETGKINTSAIFKNSEYIKSTTRLKQLTYNHIINRLTDDLKNGVGKAEDITNILNEYRNHLKNIKDKTPSLDVINDINEITDDYMKIAFSFEIEFLKEKLDNKEITREQYKSYVDNVLLMQVAMEEF